MFIEIRKQTGFNFFYNAALLEQTGKITVQVNDASLEEVLEQCFEETSFTYSIVEKTIVIMEKGKRNKSGLFSTGNSYH